MANARQLKSKVDDNTLKAWLNEMNEVTSNATKITVRSLF
jgi:DNA-binding TFAR19-related protein (PDSD5 family)